ncbi:UNC-50-like protein [Auriscalpium vulgare]|uniref:UNC-50-like protein n=1 Tax=Auriscalpium vulgare TaxID=40419 RepID=A0ACB8RBG5_9AGAM|nr:UNC-50-like protein [Auriscalpium vulgare]
MALLPTTTLNGAPQGGPSRSSQSVGNRVPVLFRRLLKFQQMDFELAAWQLTYLCLAPKRVYRNVYFHKQTKNTWARDDPAILILIAGCLVVSSIVWSVVWSYTAVSALRLAFLMIFRDFLLVGIAMATLLWFFANRVLLSPPTHSTPADTSVEWAYAFDVHTNAFFPLYLTLYLAQLFLVPVIVKNNWLCLLVGNTLYLAAFAQYIYGVYLGLNALPFLIRTELLLAPLLPLFVGYIVSLLGFNVGRRVLTAYFG